MIHQIRVGDQLSYGCVDRVINIHWGTSNGPFCTTGLEYECLFRANGKWFKRDECDGQNGGCITAVLPSVTDDTVDAYAKECEASWKKISR